MRYNDQLNIKLYSCSNAGVFTLQAVIDDYQEISFSHSLYEAGDFTIQINYNIPNALKFQRGMFVQFGNDPYMFGEILKITDAIGSDGKGSQIRTITGKDARYIFKRRVIKNLNNEENWIMTAKSELCIRNLVLDQCGDNAEQKRRLPVANTIPTSENAVGKEYSVAESFSNLYDTLVTIATQSEIGWAVSFSGSALSLQCYAGNDLSSQVQFSTNYDSLSNGEFSDSAESFANSIYVGGKGTGADRDIYEGETSMAGESPAGLARYEAWDNQSSMTSESEYEAEALSMLSQYGQTVTVSGNGLAQCPYIFKENYNVGDIITIAFSGKSAKAQILSVTEHWAWGQYGLEFSFGKPQNDLSRQLQLILKQIQKASDKTTTTSSVKYYTIPTDTAQPKADVIYDTIGFTGDAGNGATFTLYYDSEKTGAKTYHVWLKQLAGTGKLTLTTGVSGKANLELNTGTYVAIIYVDAEGNVLSQGATPTATIASGNNQPATSGGVAGAISDEATARNTAIETAINALDVAEAGGTGKYIKAISETDGKISATEGNIDSSVTLNSANPVTSGAVADILTALPTDSVLHYSFDEVPDYPDGTADVRLLDNNTYQIQSMSQKFVDNGGSTFSNSSGNLQIAVATAQTNGGAYIPNTYIKNKVIKMQINVTALGGDVTLRNGIDTTVLSISQIGTYEVTVYGNALTSADNGLLLISDYAFTALVKQIYIGSGSYSTPIIDNSGNSNHATNNGAIAVEGVSGRGVRFVGNGYLYGMLPWTPYDKKVFSFSCWVRNWDMSSAFYIINNWSSFEISTLQVTIGTATNKLVIAVNMPDGTTKRFKNTTFQLRSEFYITVIMNGNNSKVYIDGVSYDLSALDTTTVSSSIQQRQFFQIGRNYGSSGYVYNKADIDDLQIFSRALTEQEVLGLYYSKANTPKYYGLSDYKLPPVPETDGAYTLTATVSSGTVTYSWTGGTRSAPEPEDTRGVNAEENAEEHREEPPEEEPTEPEENER